MKQPQRQQQAEIADQPATLSKTFEVNALSPVLGAEVVGLDLASVTPAQMEEVKRLFLKHHLLVFRKQELSDENIEDFARAFGPLEVNQVRSVEGKILPSVHSISNVDKDGKPAKSPLLVSNYNWHSDKSYLPNPSLMTMLWAMEIPPSGGDTQFANMEMAYDDLSDEMKKRLEGLKVTQSFEYMLETLKQRAIIAAEDIPPPVIHPLVRTHPETGRKSLFVGMYSCKIEGMAREEAMPLIAELIKHATQDKYIFTQKWEPHDFVCWDNRSLVHRAIPNYEMGAHRRILRRCVVRGGIPK